MIAGISDEDAIMIVIDRDAAWLLELAWLIALLAELGHEREAIIITREYLHSMIPAISDEQETSTMVERQAHREIELAISIALLLDADRELDSSITIKSIVSHHLLHFNPSLSQRQRDAPSSNDSNQRDEDASTAHEIRDTRETPIQASKQATRSNKNQSMKEQRTAPPSLTNHSLTHTSLFLIFIIILESRARCLHALPIDMVSRRLSLINTNE